VPDNHEVVLAFLPGDSPGERVEVVVTFQQGSSGLVLRQQSHATGIGWFTQSSLALTVDQVRLLKRALPLERSAFQPKFSSPRAMCEGSEDETPTVIPFPGVRAGNDQNNSNNGGLP